MQVWIFWTVLAIVYLSLSIVSFKAYLGIKKMVGGEEVVALTKSRGGEMSIGVERRSDLEEELYRGVITVAFDLTRVFKGIFIVDMVGFAAATIAAFFSLCFLS